MISLTADKLGNFKFTEVRPGAYFFVVADQSPHFTEDKVLIKISAGREVRLPVTYERE